MPSEHAATPRPPSRRHLPSRRCPPPRRRPAHFTLNFPRSALNPTAARVCIPRADLAQLPPLRALATSFRESRAHSATLPHDSARAFVLLARYLAGRPLSFASAPPDLALAADRWGAPGLVTRLAAHAAKAPLPAWHPAAPAFVSHWLRVLSVAGPSALPPPFLEALALRLALCVDADAPLAPAGDPALWTLLRDCGALRLAVRYVTRYAAADRAADLLAVIISLPGLDDGEFAALLRELDWRSPMLADLLTGPFAAGWPGDVWAALFAARQASPVKVTRLARRARWRVAGLTCAARQGKDLEVQEGEAGDAGLAFSLEATAGKTGAEPLRIHVKAHAENKRELKMSSPVRVCLDVVEDGCVCDSWRNGGESRKRRRFWKGGLRLLEFLKLGVDFDVMEGVGLAHWASQHQGSCALILVLTVYEESAEEEESIEIDCELPSGTMDDCICERCKQFAAARLDWEWDSGIDMSGSNVEILVQDLDEPEESTTPQEMDPGEVWEDGRGWEDSWTDDEEAVSSLYVADENPFACPCGHCP